ncbi:molybdopterin-dependent oxidoreductase [Hydrogenibacillus sp. N12]|uniref:molybdopterin-dependent oxidoreductase n=1 Tax=Hydrogenibacillus sp. N12 TaxID=2866627 RepID=UPI001C7D66AF|nr:molybdopterin-dependent oxidoreductase [Hydrogenibacillus sp. N12]QZA33011.1 molybdopterin-dependent oxidoreductase [Hydrogenibacillus sp. N12]
MERLSACPLNCFDGCSLLATVDGGRLVDLRGNPDHPITRGQICGRGRGLLLRHRHPKRLTRPLKRVGDRFVPVPWEAVLDEIAERIRAAIDRFGPTAILYSYDYASGGLLTLLEERLWNRLGGMTETVSTLCWSAGLEAQRLDLGGARTSDPALLPLAKGIVLWGRNAATTNVHLLPFLRQARAQGSRLVHINPMPSPLDREADLVIRVRPGGDGPLAVAVAQALLERGAFDRTFVAHHAAGFEAYRAAVLAADRAALLRAADVDEETFARLIDVFSTPPVRAILGYGLQRYRLGGATVRAIDALIALTGSIGRPGGGVDYAHTALGESIAVHRITRPDWRRAYRTVTRAGQADEIPRLDPPPAVLYVARANPLAQAPQADRLRDVYRSIPTKIVVDFFLTETAAVADYVLPAADNFEQADIYVSSMWHGYIQYGEALVPPPGEAKPERWIVRELARRLGAADAFRQSDEAFWRLALDDRMTEADWQALFTRGFVRLVPERIAWEKRMFATPDGRFHFAVPPWAERTAAAAVAPDAGGPRRYRLLSVHPRRSLHGQHRFFAARPPAPVAYLAPEALAWEGIAPGARVVLTDGRARVEVAAEALPGLHPEAIVVEEGVTPGINALTPSGLADLGRGSTQYEAFVWIAPLRPDERDKTLREEALG